MIKRNKMERRKLSLTQNAMLNSAGAIFYYFCQWLLTVIIVKITGDYEDTGVFQLAISITNIFQIFACFVPRTFQISDSGEYSSGMYIGIRIATSFLSVIVCVIYVTALRYSTTIVICTAIYMLFKVSECISDVLRTFSQINYRMDYEFISYMVRGTVTTIVFSLILYLKHDIMLAMLGMAVSSIMIVGILDVYFAKKFVSIRPEFCISDYLVLMKKCFPIVISAALITAYVTVPRQMMEKRLGTEMLGYYASVSNPITVIQLLATSSLTPLLTVISNDFNNKKREKVKKTILLVIACLCGVWVLAVLGARLLGEQVYVIIYSESIREYCYTMYPLIACSILCVICNFVSNILVIMRKQKQNMYAALLGIALLFLISNFLIGRFGMNGVSYVILASYFVASAAGMWIAFRNLREPKEGETS